ncbi:MAG: adenylate/guanylate cyclase domain-containing protein, partial [bacterium]
MASSEVQRKLTAILCTDVVGYSRLMGDDPEGTLSTLTEYREVFSAKIQEFKGRVVNAPGDSILADFTSVLDAVSCAVDIQRELAERNHELPDERRMDFRIGVNLGDVLVKDGDIYGDGVNVAARLEALAEPGGICISGSVHEQVKVRLPLVYDFIGEKRVKNIAEPVKTYRVLSKPGAAAHRVIEAKRTGLDKRRKILLAAAVMVLIMAAGGVLAWNKWGGPPEAGKEAAREAVPPSLPARPSIAVLAFNNLSDDPRQEFFADGMSEDIITDLSQIKGLFVVARNSSFAYKGTSIDLRKVGRELGVNYILEGSIRRAGNRVRIT